MTAADQPPREKRGGKRVGSGRPAGARNKSNVEKELKRARDEATATMIEHARLTATQVAVETAIKANVKLGKEILSDFANVLAGAAAYYQPRPGNVNQDEGKFLKYTELAIYAADKLAPYQSPRLAAVMVGQAQTKVIEIVGGLPSPDDVPPELPPDMYEDSMKAIPDGGQPQRAGEGNPPDVSPRAAKVFS